MTIRRFNMKLNRLFDEAVKLGILPVVKQLVSAGADVRADNDCALQWAVYNGNTAVVNYLESEIKKLENSTKVL